MNEPIDNKINTALIKLQARQKSEKMMETMLELGLVWTKAEQKKFIEDEIHNRLNQDEMLRKLMSYREEEMEYKNNEQEEYDNES
tara:strand:+ start:245 stop:499 length:255 start_codon:yes stop_codon:yes gene_type:complete